MFLYEFIDGLVIIIEAILVVVVVLSNDHSSLVSKIFYLRLLFSSRGSDRTSSNLFFDEVQVKITVTLSFRSLA